MKHLVTFADTTFESARRWNVSTAVKRGGVDTIHRFTPHDIERSFRERHREILSQPRGCGYWLWKPHFIQRVLAAAGTGDFIFYSDAGALFIDSLDHLIVAMNKVDVDVMSFEVPLPEIQWTNHRTFLAMGCESDAYRWTNQRNGAFILFRKTPYAEAFVEEWLRWCTDATLVTDISNGDPVHPLCLSHRHDQSIYSLLCKKHALPAFRDPSDYGMRPRQYLKSGRFFRENQFANSAYPAILLHFRRADPRVYAMKYRAKNLLGRVVRL